MEDMTSNGGTGTEEHKRKANDSFLKPVGCENMPRSPRLCAPIRKDWSGSLPNDNVIGDKDNELSTCINSSAASGPPSVSVCSMTDAANIVEELPFRNYKDQNIALVNYPQNSRKLGRNQLAVDQSRYNSLCREIVPQDEKQIPFRISEGLKGIDSEFWGLKSLSSKNVNFDPLNISENISNEEKTITSSNAHLISSTMHSTSSAYVFSQLIVRQTLKGKGVICQDKNISSQMSHKDETSTFVTRIHSDTQLRLNADDNKPSLQGAVMSSVESFDNGLSLREWLKSVGHKMNKSVSLHIFKQILELVDFAHSQGVVFKHLRPSSFTLLPSSKIKYIGSCGQRELDKVMNSNVSRKRLREEDMCACQSLNTRLQKPHKETRSLRPQHHFTCIHGCRTTVVNQNDSYMESRSKQSVCQNISSCQHHFTEEKKFMTVTVQLEDKWYSSPEELNDEGCTSSSNIYSLGILLFELLCSIESWEVHSAVMMDLRQRILPPRFLSEKPKEAGFCLWLLHPEPSCRPNTRMILESEFIHELEESNSGTDVSVSDDDEEAETDQLLYFLISLKEEKQKQSAKLVEELSCLDEDIKAVQKSYSLEKDSVFPLEQMNFPGFRGKRFHFQDPSNSDICRSIPGSCVNEAKFMSKIGQLENSYFSMRLKGLLKEASAVSSYDKDVLESRLRLPHVQNEPRRIQSSLGRLGSFFEGLCKFACYSKFEERGTLRNRDLLNSANVICALSFDRDEDYIAVAGVSKKIKIFDCSTILSDSIDVQYSIVEMSNKSKLSCVCWNSYIKNHLASTDYDGVVQMWDAGTGQPFSQYMEHQKRAWSIHFSWSDPKMFASGSDDCCVKLWNIGERSSLGTIWNPANVCCVQFSAYSTHLLFFGSADYKIYGYDLRHTRIPWCTLSGHGKAVSYVKFIDSETVASASTDSSLKLWDLKKTSSSGLSSDACSLTFKGHSNEKNFVGLSVLDGYIACGSETNEVYCYHKSLPLPITSHKFQSIDPISGNINNDDNTGQFVSSVCWRKKSNMLVAANSVGIVKLLQMV